MALLDQFGHPLPPVSTSRMTARASRDAGAYRGSISGWRGPQVHSPEGESRERDVMQRRAADLAANDWAAHSAVEAISGNAIGTGLVPKASIPADMLGISSESARELGKRMEWAFALWTSEADVRGQCHFADLQNLGIRTMLSLGEMLHLAVMLNEKERERQNRAFSFALQTLSPSRLMTPSDQQSDPLLRDGVRLSEYGRPEGYWLATPKASPQSSFVSVERSALLAADFTYVPARVGHRPGVFHLFRHEIDEQVRGVSAFSKGIELFRNLSDAISYELFAQVIAASFPVFVALENGGVQLPDYVTEGQEGDGERRERKLVQDLSPGQVFYGNVAELTMEFYRRNYIEGLFLSSAVLVSPDYTTERMLAVLRLLRGQYHFGGYIHAKAIPGTSPELLEQLGYLADRLSVNIELPSEKSLSLLAPDKGRHSIFRPMKQIAVSGAASREEVADSRKAPRFAPAGQSTQMIVGASPETDYHILQLTEGLYQKYNLKRVFYSAYIPVTEEVPQAAEFALRISGDSMMPYIADGSVVMTTLNEKICAKGTAEKVAEVEKALKDGTLQVFDTSKFTVKGETVTHAFALDTDGDFTPDAEEAVFDGAFHESYFQSAPYFTLQIDGIEWLNSAYGN